jgi:HAD superfamily hydrolase (TIGR01509 family)
MVHRSSPKVVDGQNTLRPVRAVVFDIGGVLLHYDPRLLYRDLIRDPDELEWFLAEVCSDDFNATLDAGRPFDEAADELAARFPEQATLIRAWNRHEEMVSGEIPGTVALVLRLREAGVPLYLLTNMPADVFAARRRRYPVLRQFDGAVVSGEEGVLKPSAAIFERLRDRFGLDPAETLFVDDLEANVAGARAAGFLAHRFLDPEALAVALREHGF